MIREKAIETQKVCIMNTMHKYGEMMEKKIIGNNFCAR